MANSEMLLNINRKQVLTRVHRNYQDYRKSKFTHSTLSFIPEIAQHY